MTTPVNNGSLNDINTVSKHAVASHIRDVLSALIRPISSSRILRTPEALRTWVHRP